MKELPWMFGIALIIWLIVGIVILKKPFKKNSGQFFKKNRVVLLAILFAFLFTIIDIWYFVQYAPTHFRRDITNEKAIQLTATDIVKEFQANETLAYSKYNNKVVEIVGEVEKIDSDSATSTVILKTTIQGESVSARLKVKQEVAVANTVTLKGILTGFILDQVQLSEAVIINTVAAPKSSTAVPSKDSSTVIKSTKDTAKTILAQQPASKLYSTNKASVRFFSHTPEEDIEATNSQTICTLNDKTGQLSFASLIKGFHFENELMQEHFNDKDYMNSDAFPKSEFKGNITNINTVNFLKEGTYNVTAAGNLTIHGVTKKITVAGTLTNAKGKITVKSVFKIKRIDYGINTNEIADIVEVTVSSSFD